MGFTIRQKADRVGAFRYTSVFLMETLARWVPTAPELEAKVLFGRHVWDFAQHADQLGRRTGELRAPLQYSYPPTEQYRALLDTVAEATDTMQRVVGFYDGILPDLEARYRQYLGSIDPLNDEPTVRIIERILADFPRFKAERTALGVQRPDLPPPDAGWLTRVRDLARGATEFVTDRPPAKTAAGVA